MKVIGWDGVQRDSADLLAADRLMKMSTSKSVWEVIDEIMKMWTDKHPKKWDSFLLEIRDLRESRRDQKFALSKEGGLRYTLDIPQPIVLAIRKLYTPEELPMDRKFFLRWAKRYPRMKVAEKI